MEYSQLGQCALCLASAKLLESHLIPAGLYRLLRDTDPRGILGRDPIQLGDSRILQSSKQLATKLLCSSCEDRFNSQGERWVLANSHRGPGEFGLQSKLQRVLPIAHESNATLYPCVDAAEIDVDALGYFAMSVFWRAGVTTWRGKDRKGFKLDFGRYQEMLRAYLMGSEGFPQNLALWISVSSQEKPPRAVFLPFGGRNADGSWLYRFLIPGVAFFLWIGRGLSDYHRFLCSQHSPQRPLLMDMELDKLALSLARKKFATLRPSRKLDTSCKGTLT
jgi:hypothetical protein